MNKSTLCHLLYELFSSSGRRGDEGATFGNHESRKRLLRTVQALLWRNSTVLNSTDYDVSANDSALLRFYANYYLSTVNGILDSIDLKLNKEERADLTTRFLSPANALQAIEQKLNSSSDASSRGNGWLLLGHLQAFLFAHLDSIDPVRKIALKSGYLRENVAELELSLRLDRLQSSILGPTSRSSSRRTMIEDRLRESSKGLENSSGAVRPPSLFPRLREEVENFSSNVASSTFERIERLNEAVTDSRMMEEPRLRERLREAEIWRRSLERFSAKLERNFLPGFPDLVSPILSAVSSLRHGLSILAHLAASSRAMGSNESSSSYELLRFPVIGRCQENYLNLVRLCSSSESSRLSMSKIALMELENLSLAVRNGGQTGSLLDELIRILHWIRIAWREQERRREEEAKERESLFKSKGARKKEEEEEEEDYRDTFPDHGRDFLEFREQDSIVEEGTSSGRDVEAISSRDARAILEIHSSVLDNCSAEEEKDREALEPDFLRPLAQRYEVLGHEVRTWPESLSSRLVSTLSVLISHGSSSSSFSRLEDGKAYNFYKNPNVDEVERCRPLFDQLRARIDELSREWPGNPLLDSITTIIDRVSGFSVESPLSRYLMGAELVLTKVKQWEENARHDVSLAEFVESFGATILRWRRLEISRWNDSLELVEEDSRTEASRWWFFLFDLTDEYVTDDSGKEEDDASRRGKMIESLERFMTESCLIEFEGRLGLIRLFYRHHARLLDEEGEKGRRRRKELLSILWNVHMYYARFVDDVRGRMRASKEPIAKKLRDAIKIARWNDLSYWSVRGTADKTRRTLHKFAREYRNALRESVASRLRSPRSEAPSSSRREEPIEPADFLITEPKDSGKLARLARKARQYCELVIKSNDYARIRGDVEVFVEECLEESEELRNLRIDETLTEEKRRGLSKSIGRRKRAALANYFKTLATRLGISYRTGVLAWKNRRGQVMNFTCSPLDLRQIRADELFLQGEEGQAGRGLQEQWSDCDRYYYESLVRLSFLDGILSSGRGGLGAQDAERCRGLSAHLVLLAHRQKQTIAGFLDLLLPFGLQVSNLGSMRIDERSVSNEVVQLDSSKDIPPESARRVVIIPPQREFREAASNFQGLLEVLQISVKQIVTFLESCPTGDCLEEGLDLTETRVAGLRDEDVSRSAAASLRDCLGLVRGIASESNRWISIERRVERSGGGGVFLSHRGRVEFLEASHRRLDRVRRELAELRRAFTDDHPIVENVRFLIEKIDESNREILGSMRERASEKKREEKEKEYEEKLDALVTQILLVVQKRLTDSRKIGERGNETEENRDVEENLMTERLIESLERVMPDLRLNTVSRLLGELMQIIHESDVESANDRVR